MIEIKKGWTGKQAGLAADIQRAMSEVRFLTEDLRQVQARLDALNAKCLHEHVESGVCMICKKVMA